MDNWSIVLSEVAKRTRGRPKGSKNRNRIISGATVEHYCQIHNHNPTKFLIDVAKGRSVDGFEPTHEDVYRANVKLHDSIHNARAIGKEAGLEDGESGQYEIVYIEATDLPLSGEADAGTTAQALQSESIQRVGDSPQSR